MSIIELKGVDEKYRIKFVKKGKITWQEISALKAVNLWVEKGEVLGVIGRNGAGKTTLLKLIAGMLIPDKGEVKVNGKVSVLMELGGGFNPEFTGRENITLNARIYGFDQNTLDKKIEQIVEFADLGDFIDAPIKYYSQGMYMRLAFALAIFVEPDILLIDDILAVGDQQTQKKCIKKIFELKQAGRTIVLVSHDLDMIRKLCDRTVLLEKGEVIREDLPTRVIPYYLQTTEIKSDISAFLEQEFQKVQLSIQNSITSGDLRVYADTEKKALRLFFKNLEITKGEGVHSAFNVEKKRYLASGSQWQVRKVSEGELQLELSFQPLPLSQIWSLSCKEGGSLEIKIEMDLSQSISLFNCDLELALQDSYQSWASVYEQGKLSAGQYINDIAPIRLKDNKISEILLTAQDSRLFPQLLFRVNSAVDKRMLSICKRRGIDGEILNLNSSLMLSEKERKLAPGRYIYFQGEVVLAEGITLETEPAFAALPGLGKENLELFFDRGKMRLFWKEKEVTCGLGMFTSLRSSGIWYDSYQAAWEVKQQDETKIIVLGHWPHIPVFQTWQVKLLESNLLFWQTQMEIYSQLDLEIVQANIMLPSEYKVWEVGGQARGEFPEEYTGDYDILPFRFWYGPARQISAEASALPKVIFESVAKDDGQRAVVENTDELYKGRLLQYQITNSHKALPAKFTCFKGRLTIEPGD